MSRLGKVGCTSLPARATQSAFFCFATGNVEPRPRKRAKFDPERREEVKKVRERRACLRCRLLKITASAKYLCEDVNTNNISKCSGEEDPCAACVRVALATSSASEKKVLRWTDCVRTLLTDVKFFDEAIPSVTPQQSNMAIEAMLTATPVTLEFASQIIWEVDSFSDDIWRWLGSREVTSTSKVGAMSSPQFQDIIKSLVGHEISTTFRLMIYAISLAYTQQSSDYEFQLSVQDLQRIGAIAGKRCLRFLDNTLTAPSLAKIFRETDSKKKLQALFLLAFGTILAIGYAQPVTESPVFPVHESDTNKPEFSQTRTLHKAMKNHLCRTLAHHVVYLGSRLNLPISSTMERLILDTAQSIWNKEGHFIWKTANVEFDGNDEDEQPDEASSSYDYLDLDVNKWPVFLPDYYTGEGFGPQESGSSSNDIHQDVPFSNLAVIEGMRPPIHQGHGEALNTPLVVTFTACQTATEYLPLPLNVPIPDFFGIGVQDETFGFLPTCGPVPDHTQYEAQLPLPFMLNRLLV